MIEFRHGNMFMTECEALAHGCNCEGKAGAGIILMFRRKYPGAILQYINACKTGNFKPGDVQVIKCKDKYVANMATQRNLRRGKTGGAKPQFIRTCLETIRDTDYGFNSIAFPRVGCGLGGLNWTDIRKMFIDVFSTCPLKVVVYE